MRDIKDLHAKFTPEVQFSLRIYNFDDAGSAMSVLGQHDTVELFCEDDDVGLDAIPAALAARIDFDMNQFF